MALPPLNWRFVGNVKTASTSVATVLDALGTLGASLTYADGSPRVPGVGKAWTWTKDGTGASCVAVYGAAPLNPAPSVGMRYILAGDASTTTYVKLAPDTAGTLINNLLVGMNRSSGAYAGWAAALPFTSGSFSGYWRMGASASLTSYPPYSVFMWESQEACVIQVATTNGYSFACQLGALFDPMTYTNGVTCENDQRLYYMCATGDVLAGAFLSSTTGGDQAFGNTPGTGATGRCGYFPPGSGSVGYVFRGGSWRPGTALVTPSNRLALVPFWAENSEGRFLGAARNFSIARDFTSGTSWNTSSGIIGYAFGAYPGSSSDTVVLGY